MLGNQYGSAPWMARNETSVTRFAPPQEILGAIAWKCSTMECCSSAALYMVSSRAGYSAVLPLRKVLQCIGFLSTSFTSSNPLEPFDTMDCRDPYPARRKARSGI